MTTTIKCEVVIKPNSDFIEQGDVYITRGATDSSSRTYYMIGYYNDFECTQTFYDDGTGGGNISFVFTPDKEYSTDPAQLNVSIGSYREPSYGYSIITRITINGVLGELYTFTTDNSNNIVYENENKTIKGIFKQLDSTNNEITDTTSTGYYLTQNANVEGGQGTTLYGYTSSSIITLGPILSQCYAGTLADPNNTCDTYTGLDAMGIMLASYYL